ncbi:outer membrane usher protein [Pseudomonas mucidolens]|uniref:Outer membrane usher protein FimD/PapC n=1 Tax=Pseudomonas mucidolens TaxID=46679 RepID=A0A1H2N247_9PSED|nr:outer membrane usher protein [Pseudomonas mucidolens]SDU99587.1 Outer membrane usher protein FimD/PapC [Pseudomonas mucidolens]SQH32767.1 putative fimbrial outer membrane usher protein [Pseudomonas mucidolens]
MDHRKVLATMTLCFFASCVSAAEEFQFNTDVLDLKDRENLDLGVFASANFIMPGQYTLMVHVNSDTLTEFPVDYFLAEGDPKSSVACLSPAIVDELGLKENVLRTLKWWHDGACLNLDSVPGMQARGNLGTAGLYLSIPQDQLEYTAANWDPPSRWDNGIGGILFDYNINAQTTERNHGKGRSDQLSGNGTAGVNLGAWRLRGDWQTQMQRSADQPSLQQFAWSRFYALRAIPALRSSLIIGEDYLDSNLFGSFRYTGGNLSSNDNMLPPNLRGYAPEVSGVARTNAHVVIRQQGRVLYDTQVPPGAFRIQDLNDAVSGQLDVRVEEQDGSTQEFQIDTASIPYLTRPGTVRYKLAAGKPSDWEHQVDGPAFATGEFSWGVSNGWSLYGGGLGAKDYGSLAVGVGRDLMAFGALSFDVTQSRATLPEHDSLSGKSYRASYSKRFDEYDSQVTFAGYRFSEENYMSMNEFIEARRGGQPLNQSKELYTATLSKQFRDSALSVYFNYNHQTYWSSQASDRYSLSLSRYFDVGGLKNLSLSLTAYQNKANGTSDDGAYLSVSIPWDSTGSFSFSSSFNRGESSHSMSYYDRIDERNNYMLSAGSTPNGTTASGFLSHDGDQAQVVASASYQAGEYTSAGLSLQGGATLTGQGAALHRSSIMGGTRLLVDTQGVANVPVRGNGAVTRTNRFGKAVITDVNSYYRNQANIVLDSLSDEVEATQSVTQATLTEGAIGYRRFDVISGHKAMVIIRMANRNAPPFGATAQNSRGQETGIVGEEGSTYLSGMKPGETMSLHWDGSARCHFTLPNQVAALERQLELLCQPVSDADDSAA